MRFPSRRGFSFIEIIVVVAVTVFLSSFVIVYNRSSEAQVELAVEEAKIAQLILKAKGLAIATFNIPPLPCGYGLHIDYPNGRYSLTRYSDREADPDSCRDLPAGVLDSKRFDREVHALSPSVSFPQNPVGLIEDVIFVPPDPRTYIYLWSGDPAIDNPALDPALGVNVGEIRLISKDGRSDVTVDVTTAGQLDFQ